MQDDAKVGYGDPRVVYVPAGTDWKNWRKLLFYGLAMLVVVIPVGLAVLAFVL